MPHHAHVRFYAELNDFLPEEARQRDLEYAFDVAPSAKDVIEGLGIPHTEVDLVIVNGNPVDFSYRLGPGDRVSVYPVFETLDVDPIARLRPEPLRDVKFVADTHLGTLARYLRLLGFDTTYSGDEDDDELARISLDERRVLLTRDRGLLKRRSVTHGLFLRDEDPEDQLVDVVRRLHLVDQIEPFTRCMACNGLLVPAAKDDVAEQLAPGTLAAFDAFQQCADCARVYWHGAHHHRLAALISLARGT